MGLPGRLYRELIRWLARSTVPRQSRRWLNAEWRLLLTVTLLGYFLTAVVYIGANHILDGKLQSFSLGDLPKASGGDADVLARTLRYGKADKRSWPDVAGGKPREKLGLPWFCLPYLSEAGITKNQWVEELNKLGVSSMAPGDSDVGDSEAVAVSHVLDRFRANSWYQLRRYLNGGIQFLTFWLAFTGLLLVLHRARQASWDYELMRENSVLLDQRHPFAGDKPPSLFFATRKSVRCGPDFDGYVEYLEGVTRRLADWRLPTGLANVLLSSARAYQTTETVEEARERLDSGIEQVRTEAESQGSMIRYVAWAVPSVGFIGTVLGIGSALGEAHQVLAQGDQREGAIQEITGRLGTAFDTTLIALLCSLGLMLFWHLVTRYEEKAVHAFHEQAKGRVVNQLSGLELEALFRKMLAGQTAELVSLFEQHWKQRKRRDLRRELRFWSEDEADEGGESEDGP